MKIRFLIAIAVVSAIASIAIASETSPECEAAKAERREARAALDACLANYCGGVPCLVPATACAGKRQALADANQRVTNKCSTYQQPGLGQ